MIQVVLRCVHFCTVQHAEREKDTHTCMVMWSGIGIRICICYRIIRWRRISKVDGFQVCKCLPAVPRVVHMSGRGPVSVRGRTAISKI